MALRLSRLLVPVLVLALALPLPAFAQVVNERSVVDVAMAAKPSVVGLLVSTKSEQSDRPGQDHAAGTGFVFRDGYLLTNAHVVADALEVQVLFPDKRVVTITDIARSVWWDETTDIGVVKVDTRGMKALAMGDSDKVLVGELVVAIGNPLGFRLGNTVTSGILSGVGRSVGSAVPFLQLDAPINPGNSGGPLLNARGEVIGVNSAKFAEVGVEGLALAIPINTALEVAGELMATGKVERVWLGLGLFEDWKGFFGVPNEDGVEIWQIIPDGPAGHVGLHVGDKLLKIDDQVVGTEDDVHSYLLKKRPGDVVVLTVKRKGQLLQARVKLEARDALKAETTEQATEQANGIYMNLTPAQVREAAEYGRSLRLRGVRRLTDPYTAISGTARAILFTEFTYVARRVLSAYLATGKRPSDAFENAAAATIRGKVEAEVEITGKEPDFLRGAVAVLHQDKRAVPGAVSRAAGYAVAPDGSTATGQVTFRFNSADLDPTRDLELMVKLSNGETYTFTWVIKDLQ